MTAASLQRVDADERRYLADSYRQSAFDLLRAARRLRDTGDALCRTKVRVSAAAVTDLAEATSIIGALPAVPAASRREQA